MPTPRLRTMRNRIGVMANAFPFHRAGGNDASRLSVALARVRRCLAKDWAATRPQMMSGMQARIAEGRVRPSELSALRDRLQSTDAAPADLLDIHSHDDPPTSQTPVVANRTERHRPRLCGWNVADVRAEESAIRSTSRTPGGCCLPRPAVEAVPDALSQLPATPRNGGVVVGQRRPRRQLFPTLPALRCEYRSRNSERLEAEVGSPTR